MVNLPRGFNQVLTVDTVLQHLSLSLSLSLSHSLCDSQAFNQIRLVDKSRENLHINAFQRNIRRLQREANAMVQRYMWAVFLTESSVRWHVSSSQVCSVLEEEKVVMIQDVHAIVTQRLHRMELVWLQYISISIYSATQTEV